MGEVDPFHYKWVELVIVVGWGTMFGHYNHIQPLKINQYVQGRQNTLQAPQFQFNLSCIVLSIICIVITFSICSHTYHIIKFYYN